MYVIVVLVQSLSRVRLFVTPWTAARQAFLSFTISWSLLNLMSIELVMLSNHLILCCPLLMPSIFPSIRSFPVSQLFASGGQSIGASASASVLPINIQGWFTWLTGWSPCCPRDSQASSPAPQLESIYSSALSLLYDPTLISILDYWKSHNFDNMNLCWQSSVSVFYVNYYDTRFSNTGSNKKWVKGWTKVSPRTTKVGLSKRDSAHRPHSPILPSPSSVREPPGSLII